MRPPNLTLVSLAWLLLAGCAQTKPAQPTEQWLGTFPAYPRVRLLCSEHVSGPGMHVTWTSWAVTEPPQAVVAFYQRHFPDARVTPAAQLEVRGPQEKVLSVHTANDPYPKCQEGPREGEPTVILVSQAVKG